MNHQFAGIENYCRQNRRDRVLLQLHESEKGSKLDGLKLHRDYTNSKWNSIEVKFTIFRCVDQGACKEYSQRVLNHSCCIAATNMKALTIVFFGLIDAWM